LKHFFFFRDNSAGSLPLCISTKPRTRHPRPPCACSSAPHPPCRVEMKTTRSPALTSASMVPLGRVGINEWMDEVYEGPVWTEREHGAHTTPSSLLPLLSYHSSQSVSFTRTRMPGRTDPDPSGDRNRSGLPVSRSARAAATTAATVVVAVVEGGGVPPSPPRPAGRGTSRAACLAPPKMVSRPPLHVRLRERRERRVNLGERLCIAAL